MKLKLSILTLICTTMLTSAAMAERKSWVSKSATSIKNIQTSEGRPTAEQYKLDLESMAILCDELQLLRAEYDSEERVASHAQDMEADMAETLQTFMSAKESSDSPGSPDSLDSPDSPDSPDFPY